MCADPTLYDSADAAFCCRSAVRSDWSATRPKSPPPPSPDAVLQRRHGEQPRFFCLRPGQRFLQDFHLERLAAELALKLTHRSSRRRTSPFPVTLSSARTATAPPSVISRRQRYTRLGATPLRRATAEMLSPGCSVSSTMRSFSSVDQPRRRAVPVITSIR